MVLSGAVVLVVLPSAAQPAPLPPRQPGEYHHDGFYLRLALGVGVLKDSVHLKQDGLSGFERDGSVTGVGQASELAVGGALAPGLILAGGFFLNVAYTSKQDFGDVDTQTSGAYVTATYGPLVDYYPDPDAGLHFQLGGGLAVTSGVAPSAFDKPGGATGYGLVVGVGQEWWIAKQWAMGALLRLQHVEAKDNLVFLLGPEFHAEHSSNALSLMLAATYN